MKLLEAFIGRGQRTSLSTYDTAERRNDFRTVQNVNTIEVRVHKKHHELLPVGIADCNFGFHIFMSSRSLNKI